MGSRFDFILNSLLRHKAGCFGAAVFFVLSILWIKYGFFRMIFILLMSLAGYYIFEKILANKDRLLRILDKIFPEGRIR